MAVYTLGVWTAKPGREEEFVDAWREMATRTAAEFDGASAVLLRDRDQANRFISSGPWESLEQVRAWRESSTFRQGLARIRGLIEAFEPHTMDPVVVIGSGGA
jgi:heme-degrading monooxygenase HmoA